MRIRKPGKVADKLWYLGQEDFCVYLLEGEKGSMLINGAVSCIVPQILEQFREFRIDESRINRFLILHSHFDHVGVVPFFKRRHPEMVIYGSARTAEIFRKPKAIAATNESNRYVLENSGYLEACSGLDLEWREGEEIEAVAEGDCIDLGDVGVAIFETPGHSPCSVSGYVPQLKALFPSDGGGVPNSQKIVTFGTSNYIHFEESLQKLRSLEVDYLCADHCGYVAGNEAAHYIEDAIKAAKARREVLLETYLRHMDLDQAASELALRFSDENVGKMVSPETMVQAHRQMIMHVAGLNRKG